MCDNQLFFARFAVRKLNLATFISDSKPATDARKQQLFFRHDYQFVAAVEAFYKYGSEIMSWHEAFVDCERDGAHLYFPRNDNEWRVVRAKIINPSGGNASIHLGMYKGNEYGDYVTIDGKRRFEVYNHWLSGKGAQGYCVAMSSDNRDGLRDLLTNEPCTERRSFVCEKRLNLFLPCGTIDQGYKPVQRLKACYKVHKTPTPWHEAFLACRNEDSELATHLTGLTDALKLHSNALHYVGIYKQQGNDVYRYINGKAVGHTFLLMHGDSDGTSCAALSDVRLLRGWNCRAPLPFICQKRLKPRPAI
ncbi:Hemolymph lipopolysaccharide-binding protein [Eumeta japonica]|uniref:Hemolymph lipopolysaccharide-binding protein n=1 Tax=Eumeta variegata TaxID=151549 RepID=A0A4C1TXY6_EUMVA|nr:Hemolymph lipopolysaccharide-binding protein [Eumeta japonica]